MSEKQTTHDFFQAKNIQLISTKKNQIIWRALLSLKQILLITNTLYTMCFCYTHTEPYQYLPCCKKMRPEHCTGCVFWFKFKAFLTSSDEERTESSESCVKKWHANLWNCINVNNNDMQVLSYRFHSQVNQACSCMKTRWLPTTHAG